MFTFTIEEHEKKTIRDFLNKYKQPTKNIHVEISSIVNDVNFNLYKSGKMTIQGTENKVRKARDYIKSLLGRVDESVIGSDEVGTGDVFGSIVVCAAYVHKDKVKILEDLNVRDSKSVTDEKVYELYEKIKDVIPYSVRIFDPSEYELLREKGVNMNAVKALGHNHVLLEIKNTTKEEEVDLIVLDKFGPENKYYEYLDEYSEDDILQGVLMETKAEDKHIAVATAAIIARKYFLDEMKRLSEIAGEELLKGANAKVNEQVESIIKTKGKNVLKEVTKTSFKNVQSILEMY